MAGRSHEHEGSNNPGTGATSTADVGKRDYQTEVEDGVAAMNPVQALDFFGKVAAMEGDGPRRVLQNLVIHRWATAKGQQLHHPAVHREMGRVLSITELTPKQRDAAMKTVFETVMNAPLDQDPSTIEW